MTTDPPSESGPTEPVQPTPPPPPPPPPPPADGGYPSPPTGGYPQYPAGHQPPPGYGQPPKHERLANTALIVAIGGMIAGFVIGAIVYSNGVA